MASEYGIVANVCEVDRLLRMGAKVWILGGTGGEGWHRFVVTGCARSGAKMEKWTPTTRLKNFRAAWMPEHIRSLARYETRFLGERAEMAQTAEQMEAFADELRLAHPNREMRGLDPSAITFPEPGSR